MKQQNRNQLVRQWLLLATLFLAACGGKESSPDEAAIKQAVSAANQLVYEDQADLAIQKLEMLEVEAPGNPQIIEALAFAYAKRPDPGMAALYFDQAFQLNPNNTDLALYAGQAYLESGNPEAAAAAYRNFLKQTPDSPAAWKALAEAELALKRNQAALDAYLEAFRRGRTQPTHSEAATIGHLYHALGNQVQARKWYQQALRPGGDSTDRLTAQLGMFDLALREQQWVKATALMDQIEAEFPGELASGPFASARTELIKWRNAQQALQSPIIAQPITDSEIPAHTVVEETATVAIIEEAPAGMEEFSEAALLAASESAPAVSAAEVSVTTDESVTTVSETVEDNTIVVSNADTATVATIEQVANTDTAVRLGNLDDPNDPAMAKSLPSGGELVDLTAQMQGAETPVATVEETVTETAATETIAVTADGGVSMTIDTVTETVDETATLTADGALSVDDIEVSEAIEETVETVDSEGNVTVASVGERREGAETVAIASLAVTPVEEPPVLPEAQLAAQAYDAGNYVNAIRFYRRALAQDDTAELSYELSRAYYANNQFRESEIYAAEATRMEPNSVRFALNYLRSIQRTANRDVMMKELVRAKERFPTNPDITLALGKGYELLLGNTRNARFLYEEFVVLAPTHPKVPEIQQKLATMR